MTEFRLEPGRPLPPQCHEFMTAAAGLGIVFLRSVGDRPGWIAGDLRLPVTKGWRLAKAGLLCAAGGSTFRVTDAGVLAVNGPAKVTPSGLPMTPARLAFLLATIKNGGICLFMVGKRKTSRHWIVSVDRPESLYLTNGAELRRHGLIAGLDSHEEMKVNGKTMVAYHYEITPAGREATGKGGGVQRPVNP